MNVVGGDGVMLDMLYYGSNGHDGPSTEIGEAIFGYTAGSGTWHFLLISSPVGIASGLSPGRVPRAEGQPGRVARCQILY
jgi:hypothetical protein